MISLLYADSIPNAAQQAASPSPIMSLLPLVVIFVIFYFLMIRPQQRKMKEHKQMLDKLQVGDKVVTSSGIFATIVGVGDTTFDLKIADNVKVKVLKSAVNDRLGNPDTAVAKKD